MTPANINDAEPGDLLICGDEAAVYGDQPTTIMSGVEINCLNQSRFVHPSEQERLCTPVAMRGGPYDWGGSDSLERFDDMIKRGFIAGNIGGTFWSAASRRVTAGVDSSGLVSNIWHLDHHAGTSEPPDLADR
jgi:hypothetical protein